MTEQTKNIKYFTRTWQEILVDFITKNLFKCVFAFMIVLITTVAALIMLFKNIEVNDVLKTVLKEKDEFIEYILPDKIDQRRANESFNQLIETKRKMKGLEKINEGKK